MSIQTTFNKSIQGTNNIYGNILSNDDASFNNLSTNTSTSLNNTTLRNTTNIGISNAGSLNIGGFGSVNSTSANWSVSGGSVQFNNLMRIGQSNNIWLNGTNSSVNTQGLWIEWNRGGGDGKTYFINQRGTGSYGGFLWGESNTSNVLTPYMNLDQTELSFSSPLYQGSFQRKAYLSSNGTLQHYPSWTNLSFTNNTASTTSTDFVVGNTSPYLDFTNFKVITIRFQGFQNYSSVPTNKPFINCYLLINGNISTDTLNQNIVRHTTNVLVSNTNPASNYFRLMESIENNIPGKCDFNGDISLQAEFGGGFQLRVNGSYTLSGSGFCNFFGAVRSSQGSVRGYNGLLFNINNIDPNTTINFRYYIDAT